VGLHDLPALNATLNGSSAALLLWGYVNIRAGKRDVHRRIMLAAFGVSILFLISYLVYHAQVGSVKYQGTGWTRPIYFAILISHTILAAVVPVLASITLYRAWKGRFAEHRKLARIALPIWLYVNVTGVVIYVMLYHL
jgi:uncharacterized membrane protein YozB (DUF420 family)